MNRQSEQAARNLSIPVLLCALGSCVSYQPSALVPAITLSAEEVLLERNATANDASIDFGLELALNESDSLFNVEILPGVRVRSVNTNGPAELAGIQSGDVVLAINDINTDHPDTVAAIQSGELLQDFRFTVQRNTTVFEATVIPRQLNNNPSPRELYRLDPIATRAAYRTELINLVDGPDLPAAKVVEFFPDSPLPAGNIELGDYLIALDGRALNSAQDLITRLHTEHELGDTVQLTVFDGANSRDVRLQLWNPGRRISRIGLWPLLQYESNLSPETRSLSIIDLWLFAFYRYSAQGGERSHSILGLFTISSDYGELVEEN